MIRRVIEHLDWEYRRRVHYHTRRVIEAWLPFVPLPVLVYQMGKVGSRSIYETLVASGIRALHVHVLHPKNLDKVKERIAVNVYEDRFRRLMTALVRWSWKRVRVITLVRDPVSQNFSAFFQNFERDAGRNLRPEDWATIDAGEAVDRYRNTYPKTAGIHYFDRELGPVTGIDIYSSPFPFAKGYQILKRGRVSVLVLRIDTPDPVKLAAVNEFLGTSIPALLERNVSEDKDYAELYARFKQRLKLPRATVEELVDSKYCRHFYTEEERSRMFERWTE